MELSPEILSAFQTGIIETGKFWERFGGLPSLEGRHILDVGCGYGSLCTALANAGAERVVGIDINPVKTDTAAAILRREYPHLAERLEFKCIDLGDYPDRSFDYIVSKDSFEHIMDPARMLEQMKRRLKPGGKLYIGFSPLYNSPFGGHGISELAWGFNMPWGHLLLPEQIITKRLSRHYGKTISSITDVGLNKQSLATFKRIFHQSGMSVIFFKTNCSERMGLKIMNILAKIPFLREFFTHNLYSILQKEQSNS